VSLRPLTLRQLARGVRAFADALAAIDAEDCAERAEWVDQHQSVLGNRRHCRAAKARIAAGLDGAAVVGRRHLLSQSALAEELARKPEKKPKELSVAEQLRSELRLVGSPR